MKRAWVNNLNQWSRWWHKYAQQPSSRSTLYNSMNRSWRLTQSPSAGVATEYGGEIHGYSFAELSSSTVTFLSLLHFSNKNSFWQISFYWFTLQMAWKTVWLECSKKSRHTFTKYSSANPRFCYFMQVWQQNRRLLQRTATEHGCNASAEIDVLFLCHASPWSFWTS